MGRWESNTRDYRNNINDLNRRQIQGYPIRYPPFLLGGDPSPGSRLAKEKSQPRDYITHPPNPPPSNSSP